MDKYPFGNEQLPIEAFPWVAPHSSTMTSWSNSWEGAAARYEKLKTQEIFQSKQKFQRCLNSATSTLDLMHRSGAKYEFHW